MASAVDDSFKFLLYQLDCRIEAYNGDDGYGELGFDSGEGAWEMAPTSMEGSRRENYPILTQGGSDNKYQYRSFYKSYNWNEYNLNNLNE